MSSRIWVAQCLTQKPGAVLTWIWIPSVARDFFLSVQTLLWCCMLWHLYVHWKSPTLAAIQFSGHRKTLHTLIGMLGSAVLAAAVSYPGKATGISHSGQRSPENQQRQQMEWRVEVWKLWLLKQPHDCIGRLTTQAPSHLACFVCIRWQAGCLTWNCTATSTEIWRRATSWWAKTTSSRWQTLALPRSLKMENITHTQVGELSLSRRWHCCLKRHENQKCC